METTKGTKQLRVDEDVHARAKSKAAAMKRSLKSVADELLTDFAGEASVEADGKIPAHLEPIWTDRGFKHMPTLHPGVGEEVKVFESSMADSPYLWLTVTRSEDEATVHLSLECAAKVRDQLDYLIRKHYQLESR